MILNKPFEYKSKTMINNIPLVHINTGFSNHPQTAKGIVAIGDIAIGAVAIGGVSSALVSIGGISAGLISLGELASGMIVALGGIAIAPVELPLDLLPVVVYRLVQSQIYKTSRGACTTVQKVYFLISKYNTTLVITTLIIYISYIAYKNSFNSF